MSYPTLIGLLTLLMASPCVFACGEDKVSFRQDVRPILSDHCFACHGPDREHREAGLRLDIAEDAIEGGVIEPGDLESSEMWLRITSDDPDAVMPPPEYNLPLDPSQRETLKQWILDGAEYQEHWSFAPVVKPPVPVGPTAHPIDAFLVQKMATEGLTLSPPTDRRTLIRRATLDLTGLPPTPEEVDAFVNDSDPNAYERLLERLFNQETYGEHFARYWLDLARYADTHGLHLDNERSMWPYRDWVIAAFNQNLPFDDFTRWQLAGDLLDNPTREQRIASGFNRCNVTTSEGGSIAEEWIYRYALDRTTTTAEVWLGLTAGCAVCHDHKFDPITAKDYYSLYAFFHSAADPAMDGNKIDTPPIMRLYSQDEQQQIEDLNRSLATVRSKIQQRFDEFAYQDPAEQTPPPHPEIVKTVWFDDGFPSGAKLASSGGPLTLISKSDGNVFSGEVALHRRAKPSTVEQDYYSSGAKPFSIPDGGKIFVHCYLDPEDVPDAIMVQFHTKGWEHRAMWGREDAIEWGKPNTASKRHQGDLPEAGEWVRLEIDTKSLGLSPKTPVTGFAFTQSGGTVTWDYLGVETKIDKANNPKWSWTKWKQANGGKRIAELPYDLQTLVRGKKPDEWTDEQHTQVFQNWLKLFYAGRADLVGDLTAEETATQKQIDELNQNVPLTLVMADLPQPRVSFVMLRGQYDNPGEKVTRDVPGFLPPLPELKEDRPYNRLDLADWLVSGDHPLTARVTVNRFWQQLFGTGIVATSGDFGSQGEPPSHPELLDYLAAEFVEHDWDIQWLIKTIMTSDAYQQSSVVTEKSLEVDPGNRLLSRYPRLRLDGEVLRDQALFVSGLLVQQIGGKAVKPYQPPNIWEPVGFGNSNTRYYQQDQGDALYRRSLYTFFKRTAPPPFISTFDGPNREQSCTARGRSNTPLQALQLMNDIQHIEAARHFAIRILAEHPDSPDDAIRFAWLNITARIPDEGELAVARQMLESFQERYQADPKAAEELVSYGESEPTSDIKVARLAAYTMLANLLMNLDEVVNKN
ncbi:PSD1 and planctomycete cytochrome C domain-containing protein [Neorhodopirellula pilleata]|uniref:Planctomycete cytochrome C n=1 Tax=Neorhodopirellula pilleata TaxID=2714738 RepID=A0A5C6AQC7_9BACT|nr:PSD1 and planctomycete cytochrome C domain-containing protein [Neorhodopirellula pilleata]TWU01429.1 Planctomycete cytochrome C [Neorhodopirellula pilleata]